MLGEAGAWRKHRFGIILGAFFCLFLLLSLGLFAFSSPKAPIGTVLPEHSVYEEQVRLFALPDGGFLCVSVHDSQTYLLYLNPDGTPRLREDELELEVLDFPFGQISLTGDTLFLSGQKVDREETIGYLLEFPLSAASGMMDQVQSFSNDWYEFLTDSFRQTGDGRYYGIRQGDIALFSAEICSRRSIRESSRCSSSQPCSRKRTCSKWKFPRTDTFTCMPIPRMGRRSGEPMHRWIFLWIRQCSCPGTSPDSRYIQ